MREFRKKKKKTPTLEAEGLEDSICSFPMA
jgi:hypothetical protein